MIEELLLWYDANKRDLPWRSAQEPYKIWLSEIMLQQTRVETVIAYWTRFLQTFPTVHMLAEASETAVLKLWEGLGYYSRARNLHACAKVICDRFGGVFPEDGNTLRSLPGVGSYTAGAIASIAFGVKTPAVDGNVIRVITRLYGIREDVARPSVRREIEQLAERLVPNDRPGDCNQALMELGATVCKPTPICEKCPVQAHCDAHAVGDMGSLPVKQSKPPQRVIPVTVMLIFHKNRVLVEPRKQGLLRGMWCFPCLEYADTTDKVERELHDRGINMREMEIVGHARHIFTHRIWEMIIVSCISESDTCPPDCLWADAVQLAALPLPTAVKVARAWAMARLS